MTTGADWIEQARRLLDAVRGPEPTDAATSADHAADCRWCPVCQAAAVVRGERPEVTAALADVLTTAAAALRTFAADAAQHVQPAPEAEDEPAAGAEEPPPQAQRIDIA
ncbi:hypothetical protein GCU60_01980 [Blastococcus saxobsidens]|uniref:Uncharacterized protein n=1 Tax=Blastococcus saxobsidens TaxID=138336 RepID=A0A6L9VXN7_9ACTN|nr:hypothetical protein [Blastococcus saxobsidens]NEK84535.1 hypothetical protein [Blastococcus saxobsidens]